MGRHGPEPAHIEAIHPLYTLKVDVIFAVRDQQVRVRLDRRTADRFQRHNAVGTTGLLTWKGRRMVKWQPVGTPTQRRSKRVASTLDRQSGIHRSFISYPGAAAADARWVAQVLVNAGIDVWLDEQQLVAGDSLPDRIVNSIRSSQSFVPIVDQAYLNSDWCARELHAAADAGIPVVPVKFSFEKLVVPRRLRDVYEILLGDPLMVDLRRADAEDQLLALAKRLRLK